MGQLFFYIAIQAGENAGRVVFIVAQRVDTLHRAKGAKAAAQLRNRALRPPGGAAK